jgi:hypothetical protein
MTTTIPSNGKPGASESPNHLSGSTCEQCHVRAPRPSKGQTPAKFCESCLPRVRLLWKLKGFLRAAETMAHEAGEDEISAAIVHALDLASAARP